MPFIFNEIPKSRAMSAAPPSETRKYYASGSADQNFVMAHAVAATPSIVVSNFGVLYRHDIQIESGGTAYFNVTVPYGPNPSEFQTGTVHLSFDTTGGTGRVVVSKETRNRYSATGTPFIPDHKQAIAVNGDNVEGAEIVIPALKLTATFRHPKAIITLPKIKYLATITGTVNSDSFLTFSPGEVLFLGCTGEEGTDVETSIAYHFACSQNANGLSFGDIANVVKRGWDIVWIQFKEDADGGYPIKPPEFAFVERVYEEIPMKVALGFG